MGSAPSSNHVPEATNEIAESLKEPKAVFDGKPFGADEMALLDNELSKEDHAHVEHVSITCTPGGARALEDFIAKNSLLRVLLISSSHEEHIGDEGVACICRGVCSNKSLNVLKLSCCVMTSSSGPYLAHMIRTNESLKELDLSSNHRVGDGVVEVVEAVVEKERIAKLNLMDVGSISMEGMQRMAAALKQNRMLTSLCLSHCSIGAEGGLLLGQVLHKDGVLEELFLDDCDLGYEGINAVLDAVHHNMRLRRLSLADNGFGPIAESVANMLKANSFLRALDLSGHALKERGLKEICLAMEENSSLRELRLARCGLSNFSASVGAMLQRNSSLRVLDLSENLLYASQSLQELADGLVGHKSLATLKLTDKFMMYGSIAQQLLAGNGSLVEGCSVQLQSVCDRNAAMHSRARQAVQAWRVLWKQEGSNMHALPKDVARMIASTVWDSKTEIAVWAKQK